LQPGQTEGAFFYMDAGMGLCRLAEVFGAGPASFTTIVPLNPTDYQAALANDVAKLPSLETLAAAHTALIQSCTLSGPCILVGHSFGGLLAFEVAHQLQCAGRRVDLVLLLDSWGEYLPWWQKLRTITLASGWKSIKFRLRRFCQHCKAKINRMAIRFAGKTVETKSTVAASRNLPLDYTEANWDALSKIIRKAHRGYQFQPLESRAVLFRAKDSEYIRLNAIDRNMGWGGLFKGGLEIVDCPGDHYNVLKSPNLQLLAQHFHRCVQGLSVDSPAHGKLGLNREPNATGDAVTNLLARVRE
jgi:thioesterase domain-containing protein